MLHACFEIFQYFFSLFFCYLQNYHNTFSRFFNTMPKLMAQEVLLVGHKIETKKTKY